VVWGAPAVEFEAIDEPLPSSAPDASH
jgi:hypothetical protein